MKNTSDPKSTYRKGSFLARMDALLPEGEAFNVIFHELWADGEGGYSVNNSWYGARNCTREEAITHHLLYRWEVFKLNYLPRACVKDIQDVNWEEDENLLEVDCTAFATVRKIA